LNYGLILSCFGNLESYTGQFRTNFGHILVTVTIELQMEQALLTV